MSLLLKALHHHVGLNHEGLDLTICVELNSKITDQKTPNISATRFEMYNTHTYLEDNWSLHDVYTHINHTLLCFPRWLLTVGSRELGRQFSISRCQLGNKWPSPRCPALISLLHSCQLYKTLHYIVLDWVSSTSAKLGYTVPCTLVHSYRTEELKI